MTASTWNPTAGSSRWLAGRCAAEVPRVPAAGRTTHGDGLGLDRQALRRRRRLAGASQNEWKNLALDGRGVRIAAERQERSRPLLNGLHAWLEAEAPKVLPKSQVRGAMDYTLNNWAALSVYTEDGCLDIDNNEGQNAVRGLCLERRTGSSWAATVAAGRQQSISACWPPASATATIPGPTSATFSPGYRRCYRRPAKTNFSLCSPTAGSQPDPSLSKPAPQRFLPTCSAGRLPLNHRSKCPRRATSSRRRPRHRTGRTASLSSQARRTAAGFPPRAQS